MQVESSSFKSTTLTVESSILLDPQERPLIDHIQLLRNIGQFDSVSTGSQLPLTKLTLIYAGNGRGKTTLAAILRSLSTGDPVPIAERHRLAAIYPPHIVLTVGNSITAVFQNGAWSGSPPDIAVFDDIFVAENVCAGVDVEPEHRQKLHDLILGVQGVTLSKILQDHVTRIEDHNRELRKKGDAIPAAARGYLTVDAFCSLEAHSDIGQAIQEAERSLAAARAEDAIRNEKPFDPFTLPVFDIAALSAVLQSGLPELDASASARVQSHVGSLGSGGEAWVADGVRRVQVPVRV